jgi:spermidine synthase
MTGPFLVRVLTSSVQHVGSNTGGLTAIATLGSVAGTILIGYVLVPLLANSTTLLLTAVLLLGIVLAFYGVWGRRAQNGVAIASGVALALLGGLAGARRDALADYSSVRELFRGNSNFGRLQVLENTAGTRRSYLNDLLTQNTYDPHAKQSLSLFTYMLHDLARAYAPQLENVLCIGLGVGIVPMQLAREGANVEVVEINPAVVRVAGQFFDCQPARLRLEIGDGRSFLNKTGEHRYDAVVLDAFLGDSSPSHLMTREAFRAVRRVLKPDGVLVMNIFGDFSPERGFLTASLEKTLKSVFPGVRIHASGNGNVFFVASARPQLEILHPPDFLGVPEAIRPSAESAFSGVRTTDSQLGIVLTDDYNPVEFYDAPNREAWRRSLALSMKSL